MAVPAAARGSFKFETPGVEPPGVKDMSNVAAVAPCQSGKSYKAIFKQPKVQNSKLRKKRRGHPKKFIQYETLQRSETL